MGVQFDYTQAEEAEPDMSWAVCALKLTDCKSAWRLEHTAITVSPHARTS